MSGGGEDPCAWLDDYIKNLAGPTFGQWLRTWVYMWVAGSVVGAFMSVVIHLTSTRDASVSFTAFVASLAIGGSLSFQIYKHFSRWHT